MNEECATEMQVHFNEPIPESTINKIRAAIDLFAPNTVCSYNLQEWDECLADLGLPVEEA